MYTGIIKDIGRVRAVRDTGRDRHFEIETALPVDGLELGASVSLSGVCLTVTEKGSDWFLVKASAETLSKTTLGSWREGAGVNLEFSLKLGDDLGGHFVFGHVDGLAEVVSVTPEGESRRLKIRVPDALKAFIVSKGSVALDGVSLTVNEVEGAVFGINIIPYTWAHTTFKSLKPGDKLNLEVDMLARYVRRMLGDVQEAA